MSGRALQILKNRTAVQNSRRLFPCNDDFIFGTEPLNDSLYFPGANISSNRAGVPSTRSSFGYRSPPW